MIKKSEVIYFDDRNDNLQWFLQQLIFIYAGLQPLWLSNPVEENKKKGTKPLSLKVVWR